MKNLLKLSALNKLLKLAAANLKKSISVSIILTALFVVAALLLNAGLLVTVGYGRFFGQLKEELNTADAYYMIPDTLYTEDLTEYFDENEHVTQTRWENVLLSNASIRSDAGQGDEKSYTVLFRRAETVEGLSQWKTVGDSLPAEEMSVFIPDIFKAVGGYQLGDAINLTCPTLDGGEQTLTLTVAGFSEDIFFSSADTGPVSFYLPGETYDQLGNLLRDAVFPAQLIFTALDSVDNAVKVENGARELLNLNATSMMTPDASRTLTSMDVSLTELSRCMMASMVAVMMVVFAMILVAVCLLVVRFRIVNSIGEDMVNIGSLKSVGYSSGQIILSILLQFGVIAYIGSIIGIALSYLILPAIANIFEQQSGLRWEQGFDLILSAASYYHIGFTAGRPPCEKNDAGARTAGRVLG